MSTADKTAEPRKWFNEMKGRACVEALNKNGFNAVYFATKDEAKQKILDCIPPQCSVGIGGSVTVRELGIPEALKARGNRVYDHWDPTLNPDEKAVARDSQIKADVFLSGTNALTLGGGLVNVDGSGNRVAAMIFGPKISIVVCGCNKIVPDVKSGIRRVKEYAAPVNYKRLNVSAPCTLGEGCDACSPTNCRITTVIEAKPMAKDEFFVIVVGEDLGY